MTTKEDVKNFSVNINKTILKLSRTNEPITADERKSIVQFYLEVISYLANDF
jgi:hypothetical protein